MSSVRPEVWLMALMMGNMTLELGSFVSARYYFESDLLPYRLFKRYGVVSVQLFDADEFVLGIQFHLEVALYAGFCQITLNIACGEDDASSVVGTGRDGLGNALVNAKILVVTQIESKANEIVAHS